MAKHDLPEGTRVSAPDSEGMQCSGFITNNLTVMYFITFDDGTERFVFKAEDVTELV